MVRTTDGLAVGFYKLVSIETRKTGERGDDTMAKADGQDAGLRRGSVFFFGIHTYKWVKREGICGAATPGRGTDWRGGKWGRMLAN